MVTPNYYDVNSRPTEQELADYIYEFIDGVLSEVVVTGTKTLDFVTKAAGIGTVASLPFAFSQDNDRWYVNGVEFFYDALGTGLTSGAIGLAATAVAAAILGVETLPLVLVGVIGGAVDCH